MLHFRRRILPLLIKPGSPPQSTAIIAPLVTPRIRLLSTTTTAAVSPKPFAVEDYLVATCGLTREQAVKASEKLSHLRSPSKPDAVHAFLSDLGLSRADIAFAVAGDPRLLCAYVERNLAKRVDELGGLGLSRSEIARLVPLARSRFRSRSLGTKLGFWLQVVGSFDKLLRFLKWKTDILRCDLDKVVKPNMEFLKQCGMNICDVVSSSNLNSIRLFTVNPNYLREAVARVEELGLDRSSRIFKWGLVTLVFTSKETVARNIRLLKKLGFSQDDLVVIFRKAPQFVALSEKRIRESIKFLKRDIGLEERYIAQRPALLLYSLERRLLPRHRFLNVLRTRGLLNGELDYYFTAAMSEKKFVQRFVDPYKGHTPGLAGAYTSSCSGEAANGFASLLAA